MRNTVSSKRCFFDIKISEHSFLALTERSQGPFKAAGCNFGIFLCVLGIE